MNRLIITRNSVSTSNGRWPLLLDRCTNHVAALESRIALRFESDQNRGDWLERTYADLHRNSLRIAKCIPHSVKGKPVAFLVDAQGDSFASTLLAIWLRGGVAVPLCLSHPREEIDYVLDDTKAPLVISDSRHSGQLAHRTHLEQLNVDNIEPASSSNDLLSTVSVDLPALESDAIIIYTSGTTSRPKGVVHPHVNLEAGAAAQRDAWALTGTDRLLNCLPLHHVHGVINGLYVPLFVGASVLPMRKFDAERVWNLFRSDAAKLSLFYGVPTMYSRLIDFYGAVSDTEQQAMRDSARRLRLCVSGSAALPRTVFDAWERIAGAPPLERYGMTECLMALTNSLHAKERVAGAVGRPFDGVETRIVNDGELLIRGTQLFSRYLNRKEATVEAMEPVPMAMYGSCRRCNEKVNDDSAYICSFECTYCAKCRAHLSNQCEQCGDELVARCERDDSGWLRTGDRATIDKGLFRIEGRLSSDIFKVHGYKVSALQIESVLLEHENVAEAAVVGLPDTVESSGGERLAAAITVRGDSIDENALRAHCEARLAPYKVPRLWRIGQETLPRNAMGKVQKKEVIKLFN